MVELRPKKFLYVYSTPVYEQLNWLKIGETKYGEDPDRRILQQFGTSNPELPIKKLVLPLPDGKSDHNIHAQLVKNGIKRKKDAAGVEWYVATLHDVQVAYNEICFGSSRPESYPLREEQRCAVEKAVKWFKGEHPAQLYDSAVNKHRFLLNAKMRFGKCFTSVHLAKALAATRTLVVTYKPEVISEWLAAVNEHVNFDGWLGVRARRNAANINEAYIDDDGALPSISGPLVVCVSLQDLEINPDGTTKRRLNRVLAQKWDLIIFDEVHYGSRTMRSRAIVDGSDQKFGLRWKNRLDLSGTPFRLIQEEDFCAEQVFTYSYLDEQERKRKEATRDPTGARENTYRVMPDLRMSTIEITEVDIQKQRDEFLTDDLDFSLNTLFKVGKGNFVHANAVSHFIDGLSSRTHDATAVSVFGKLGDSLGVPAKRHSVWWMSRVDSVRTMAKLLKKHPYFSNFEIISAAGAGDDDQDSTDNADHTALDKFDVERRIQDACDKEGCFGTITLTVRRFLTGVTIKQWDSILVLNDVQAAESYFQAIFRVQSAWVDRATQQIKKPTAWIFDFAITRCLRLTFQYGAALADQVEFVSSGQDTQNDSLQPMLDGLCDSLCVKRFFEGKLVGEATTSRDVFEAVNFTGSRLSLARRITSDALVNFSALSRLVEMPGLLDILERIKGYRIQRNGNIEDFLQIGVDASLLEGQRQDASLAEDDKEKMTQDFVDESKDKKGKERKQWFATQIKRLAICISDFVYMTEFREHKIDHVIETKDSAFFSQVTGISKDEFKILCDLDFINRNALNRIVREFRIQEESSLDPNQYILENIGKILFTYSIAPIQGAAEHLKAPALKGRRA